MAITRRPVNLTEEALVGQLEESRRTNELLGQLVEEQRQSARVTGELVALLKKRGRENVGPGPAQAKRPGPGRPASVS